MAEFPLGALNRREFVEDHGAAEQISGTIREPALEPATVLLQLCWAALCMVGLVAGLHRCTVKVSSIDIPFLFFDLISFTRRKFFSHLPIDLSLPLMF